MLQNKCNKRRSASVSHDVPKAVMVREAIEPAVTILSAMAETMAETMAMTMAMTMAVEEAEAAATVSNFVA